MSDRLPISVTMISGAEAHRIGRALESVATWTSEIIVVLNENVADGTDEIAAKFGAKVFREPWKGHIAQKNSAAEKASHPWLLGLDSDEVVSAELREEMHTALGGGHRAITAYTMPRLSWFCGRWIRHGDWYPDRQTRLWRRGQARWGGVDPHDRLIVDGATARLRGNLHHHSSESINARLQKLIPFSDEFVAQRGGQLGSPSVAQLAARPAWRFLRAYILKGGFLDGWQGFYIASHTAFSTLVRYAKIREAHSARPSTVA